MHQQHIESNDPSSIRLTLEKEIESKPQFWRLVHSTAKTSEGDARKCFTRVYELIIMGEPTGLGIRFFYDYRNGGKSTATFDPIVLKAIEHQIAGDFQEDKIEAYLNKHTRLTPWWAHIGES